MFHLEIIIDCLILAVDLRYRSRDLEFVPELDEIDQTYLKFLLRRAKRVKMYPNMKSNQAH